MYQSITHLTLSKIDYSTNIFYYSVLYHILEHQI